MTSAPEPSKDEHYSIGDIDVSTVGYGGQRPRRPSILPWFLLVLVLGGAGALGFYWVWPMRAHLVDSERLLSQTNTDLNAARSNIDALTKERDALTDERDRLNGELTQKTAALAEVQKAQDELAQTLEEEIKKGEVAISDIEGQLRLDVNEKILFDSGEAELNDNGKEVLKRVGETLVKLQGKVLQVGGHTDAVPIAGKLVDKFPTNWELSTQRALNVVRFLQDEVKVPGERLIVAGFSQYRPVASNGTPTGRRQNRRIDITLIDAPKGKH